MPDRPRFFDDFAGVAGGAMSAFAGLRDEAEAMMRARLDEAIRALDLVRRDELDAVETMAAAARAGQESAERRLAAVELRLALLEARLATATAASTQTAPGPAAPAQPGLGSPTFDPLATDPPAASPGGPGMIA